MHERRQSIRFRLRDLHTVMTWVAGSEQVACDAEVVDISGGGARVLAGRAPRRGRSSTFSWTTGRHRRRWWRPTRSRSLSARPADIPSASNSPTGSQSSRSAIAYHERRLWQRFPVRETRVRLACLVDGSMQVIRGELSNIGGGGAAIIVDVFSP